MDSIFDEPQWSWKLDDGAHKYAGMSNKVDIAKGNLHLVIPSELFKFLADRYPSYEPKHLTLYIDETGTDKQPRWTMGFQYKKQHVDLWYYTPSTLPAWGRKL